MNEKMDYKSPDQRSLNSIQARRLSDVSGVDANLLHDVTVAQLSERYRWEIDADLLFFRRVCGRVVKKDPTTGQLNPVPFATVHVEDTDLHLLAYFPAGWKLGWYFPLHRHREELATVKTDACGRFCVLVPRFDVDAILKWRKERICFGDIFEPLNICDIHPEICEGLQVYPERPYEPGPWLEQLKERIGPYVAGLANSALSKKGFGERAMPVGRVLEREVGRAKLAPPISQDLRKVYSKQGNHALATSVGLSPTVSERLPRLAVDRGVYIGPFRRCFDVFVPEWTLLLDVPDITFRVTQDVNGDGIEETIYDESYFDVRWDAGAIPDVTLEASQIAVSVPASTCDVPDLACADPAIVLAGLMPVQNPAAPAPAYVEAAFGTAARVNRPHPSGAMNEVLPLTATGSAPFCWDLQLRGCNQTAGAKYYRLNYRFRAPGGAGFSAPLPFTGLSWQQVRWIGTPGHLDTLTVTSDANGWYEILDSTDGWMDPYLLLNWPTRSYQDGTYDVQMEFADASKVSLGVAASASRFRVDNTVPVPNLDVEWRILGTTTWHVMPPGCKLVKRSPGDTIEFKVEVAATLGHLRAAELYSSGCGGVRPTRVSALPALWEASGDLGAMSHWHVAPTDNSVAETVTFELGPAADPGVYGFTFSAYSRSFNPAGGDGGFTADYFYDSNYIWGYRHVSFAVIDA